MSNATVARWRRYGKDRLYVTAQDGTRLGWHDLLSGEDHLDEVDHADEYRTAIATWKGGIPQSRKSDKLDAPVPVVTTGCVRGVQAECPIPEGQDLAARRAGALAREQAEALRNAAPVRTLLARVLGVRTEERNWRLGALGEEKVAAQLTKLTGKDPRWAVLHAVPVGERGADIDHVVVGPGGVFTLNAKHHPGAKLWVGGDTIMVNGSRYPYVRNSRFEAARASKLLTTACGFPVTVTGLLVPVGAEQITIKTAPTDVYVVNRMALVKWFRAQPRVLDATIAEAILTAARRLSTWQPTAR